MNESLFIAAVACGPPHSIGVPGLRVSGVSTPSRRTVSRRRRAGRLLAFGGVVVEDLGPIGVEPARGERVLDADLGRESLDRGLDSFEASFEGGYLPS